MSSLKIAVDIRMLTNSGIGIYLQNLIPYFEKSKHKFFLLGEKGDIKTAAPIYSLREQWEIPLRIPKCDLYWAPHFNVCILPTRAKKRIVTIHDLYHLVHIDQFSFHKRFYIKTIISRAIATSFKIICVSEFSKNEILRFFPESEKKLQIIYSGSGHHFSKNSVDIPAIAFPFFLYVGNCKPHKNIQLLIHAFKKFLLSSKEKIHLVIAGKKEGFIHGMEFPEIPPIFQEKIHFLGSVPEQQLAWLYQNARALIFPSLYEGWGFPPLEAMQFGCPVIASHAASIPEACQDAALYFDPNNVHDLCEKMLHLPNEKEKLIQAGLNRVGQLSWKISAENHLQLFEEAMQK